MNWKSPQAVDRFINAMRESMKAGANHPSQIEAGMRAAAKTERKELKDE